MKLKKILYFGLLLFANLGIVHADIATEQACLCQPRLVVAEANLDVQPGTAKFVCHNYWLFPKYSLYLSGSPEIVVELGLNTQIVDAYCGDLALCKHAKDSNRHIYVTQSIAEDSLFAELGIDKQELLKALDYLPQIHRNRGIQWINVERDALVRGHVNLVLEPSPELIAFHRAEEQAKAAAAKRPPVDLCELASDLGSDAAEIAGLLVSDAKEIAGLVVSDAKEIAGKIAGDTKQVAVGIKGDIQSALITAKEKAEQITNYIEDAVEKGYYHLLSEIAEQEEKLHEGAVNATDALTTPEQEIERLSEFFKTLPADISQ